MTDDNLWQAVLGEIELTVSRGNFMTWFKNTRLIKQSPETIVIGVQNIFIKQQLERKYNELICSMLEHNGLKPKTIEYKISALAAPAPNASAYANEASMLDEPRGAAPGNNTNNRGPQQRSLPGQDRQSRQPNMTNSLAHSYRPGLNERYNFDNFVVGASNELAFAACQAIAQQPGVKYNPLFLYGGVGIGKTHLIQAAGNAIGLGIPNGKILYISTEQFVQEFVDALKTRKTAEFASFYRTADVLIVDDIQFIAGKEKIQEEFFHTFNALHQNNKQIIISSDKPAGEIPTLEDRLRSRLNGGMSIDMQIPDFETRCAIVQTKAEAHQVNLEPDVVEYLAITQTNIRELEASLNQLLAWCEMRNLEPTLAIATAQLNVNKTRPKHLSAKQIIERTARHFQVPMDDMLGPKRDKDIVVPRQIAMYMLRSELHLSFPKIARELGRKDHTTAIHSVDKIEKESRVDASLRSAITEIKEHLYA